MKLGRHSDKKKAFLLLLGLISYCFLMILVFNFGDVSGSVKEKEILLEGNLNEIEYRRVEEVEEIELEVANSSVALNSSENNSAGNVLNATIPGCEGIESTIASPQFFCSPTVVGTVEIPRAGENVESKTDENGTITVSKNAEITVVEVTAPAILFSGSIAPFDNVVKINNPGGRIAFRNAAEIINPEYDYLANMPPGFSSEIFEETKGTDKDPFLMHFSVAEIEEEPGKAGFDSEEHSLCPEVVNSGEFNVKKSNVVADDLTRSITPPGLMELGNREETGFCTDFNQTDSIELGMEEVEVMCTESTWQKFWRNFVASFKVDSENDTAEEGYEIQGIKMDAPLGSAESCNEEDCTIRYLEAGRLKSSPPTISASLYPASVSENLEEYGTKDYIVSDFKLLTTPCKIRVDSEIKDTKCFWDLSAWQHLFKLEEIFTYPGFENKYPEELYWQAVEMELKGRGVALDFEAVLAWMNHPNNYESIIFRSLDLELINAEMGNIAQLIAKAKAEDPNFQAKVDQLRAFLAKYPNSPFASFSAQYDINEFIVAVSNNFKMDYNGKNIQLDYRLIYAIALHESSLGTKGFVNADGGTYNAWGWGVYGDGSGYRFDNWYQGIWAVSQGLFNGYYNRRDVSNEGTATDAQLIHNIGAAYAADSKWADGVIKAINSVGSKIGN
jgi:hypothetical protein